MPRADAAPAPPSQDRALFALWALFWLLMIVVAIEDNRGSSHIRWWEPYVWEGSSCIVATVWLLAERRAARRWGALLAQPRRWFARHLTWMPLVIPSFVAGIYALRHAVYALTTEAYEHPSWSYLAFYETVKLLLFASLWLGIIFGLESFQRWRTERERLLALQKHLAESQLAQLRAQLQPHFLFNALNTISSLMQVDVTRADRLLVQLADLLRASLASGVRHTTSLREEMNVLGLYARIMQERHAGRVTLEWHVADDALEAQVPAMLLQPLLENAFRHGVERTGSPTHIRVDARREHGRLRIAIHNTGTLAPAQAAAGIGLANCRERLALLYGGHARLELESEAGGVAARLDLPCDEARAP
jgi:two-component system, LytTR family, sensor kinase